MVLRACLRRHGRGPNPFAVVATAIAVAAVVNAVVSTPPPVTVDVGYYGESRPGYVWVNGRHTLERQRLGLDARLLPDRADEPVLGPGGLAGAGEPWVWVDGYWANPRAGYVYVDGYYDNRDSGYVWTPGTWEAERPGHVYVQGSWSTTSGRRTWNRGGWRQTSSAQGGVMVRDHR